MRGVLVDWGCISVSKHLPDRSKAPGFGSQHHKKKEKENLRGSKLGQLVKYSNYLHLFYLPSFVLSLV